MKPRDKLKPSKKDGKICKVCVGCQRHFFVFPSQDKRGRKYCSRKCMLSISKRNCVDCGMPFMAAKYSKKRSCGSKCPAKSVTYSCMVCKVEVTRPRCFGYGKYCSFECRRADIGDAADILPGGLHKQINPRRAQYIKGGDLIDKYDVYVFYDWKCIICDDYIDPDLRWPDPLSATLEHVIPLSRGGTHTWDNVAPAHLLCNEDKKDEVDDTLISKHAQIWEVNQNDRLWSTNDD